MEFSGGDAGVAHVSRIVHEAFCKYDDNFARITRRAKGRFENRDWDGSEKDLGERLELYTKTVARTLTQLERVLGDEFSERQLWRDTKRFFGERVTGIPDGVFLKTFYNSICRRIFSTVGIDPEIQFVDLHHELAERHNHSSPHRDYINWGKPEELAGQFLEDFAFAVPYADHSGDCELIHRALITTAEGLDLSVMALLRLEFLPAVFYQSTRAYLVGQAIWLERRVPLVVALKRVDEGIRVDAVLTEPHDVSVLFGYTRSYFFVDLEPVEGALHFIRSLLPHKPLDELYTVLGRVRQGKTERYRLFSHHLRKSTDKFIHAKGDRGLVMIVFTLPSYDLVFKVIRDSFGYPKTSTRADVMERYQFVFKHDRVGRLIDTQEFTHLEFPLSRFEDEVIAELLTEAGRTVRVDNDKLVLGHLYLERRIMPLNLFLREQKIAAAAPAIIDYGQAIKDLARSNVFPGDLLLKNFGVTRHGRVIFYDYDELCLVTDCNFRELPPARHEDEELRAGAWFHVAPNDVFPEEFIRFLALPDELREVFLHYHADLLSVGFWRDLQAQHSGPKTPEVVPYYKPRPQISAAKD